MQSNQNFRRGTARWVLAAFITGIAALTILYFLFDSFPKAGYPPYFSGLWIFIPLFFFSFFFLFRCWGWGYWWNGRFHRNYDPGLETLRERFARGELTKEQYDQMRRVLETTR